MTTVVTRSRRRFRLVVLTVVALPLVVSLAGCSGGSDGSTPQGAPSAGAGSGRGGQREPGVSGLIAAVSGKTLQVQSSSEQTAVTWTDKTAFTQLKATTAAALKTGLCANVRASDNGSSAGTTVAAASVTLSPAVDGRCTGGMGGRRPSGAPSGATPSGAAPSGGPGPGGFRGANGAVSSVDGSTFVVAATEPGATGTTDVTVTTSDSTTWSQLAKATSSAATVGRCAFALGSTASTGSVTATTIRLSAPMSDGTCGGFGGRGAGQGGRGGGQPSGRSTTNG